MFTESGIIDYSEKRGLNQATGELLFTNRQAEQFVVVDGPTLDGQLILADGSRGWGEEATWNPQENKLYIPLMGGFFIYDVAFDLNYSFIIESITQIWIKYEINIFPL